MTQKAKTDHVLLHNIIRRFCHLVANKTIAIYLPTTNSTTTNDNNPILQI